MCLRRARAPRLHSPAQSRPNRGNSDTRRPLGTRRNTAGPWQATRIQPVKTGFARSVGGAVWALTADPCSREAQPQRLLDYSTPTVHRCGVRRRNRSTQSPSAAQAARALLPRRTRARRPASPPSLRRQTTKPPRAPCCPGSEGINARARRPWARKKRRRTMNHLH